MRFFSAESKPHNFSVFLMVREVHCAVFGRFFKKIVRFCGFMRFSDTFMFGRAKNQVCGAFEAYDDLLSTFSC